MSSAGLPKKRKIPDDDNDSGQLMDAAITLLHDKTPTAWKKSDTKTYLRNTFEDAIRENKMQHLQHLQKCSEDNISFVSVISVMFVQQDQKERLRQPTGAARQCANPKCPERNNPRFKDTCDGDEVCVGCGTVTNALVFGEDFVKDEQPVAHHHRNAAVTSSWKNANSRQSLSETEAKLRKDMQKLFDLIRDDMRAQQIAEQARWFDTVCTIVVQQFDVTSVVDILHFSRDLRKNVTEKSPCNFARFTKQVTMAIAMQVVESYHDLGMQRVLMSSVNRCIPHTQTHFLDFVKSVLPLAAQPMRFDSVNAYVFNFFRIHFDEYVVLPSNKATINEIGKKLSMTRKKNSSIDHNTLAKDRERLDFEILQHIFHDLKEDPYISRNMDACIQHFRVFQLLTKKQLSLALTTQPNRATQSNRDKLTLNKLKKKKPKCITGKGSGTLKHVDSAVNTGATVNPATALLNANYLDEFLG